MGHEMGIAIPLISYFCARFLCWVQPLQQEVVLEAKSLGALHFAVPPRAVHCSLEPLVVTRNFEAEEKFILCSAVKWRFPKCLHSFSQCCFSWAYISAGPMFLFTKMCFPKSLSTVSVCFINFWDRQQSENCEKRRASWCGHWGRMEISGGRWLVADFFVVKEVKGKSKESKTSKRFWAALLRWHSGLAFFLGTVEHHPGAFVIFSDHVTCSTHETYQIVLETAH